MTSPSPEGSPSPDPEATPPTAATFFPGLGPLLSVEELEQRFPDLPPDPGAAGTETLEGIDSDGDGVRDDVQRFIYRAFPDDDQKRLAFLQYARARQEDLVSADDQQRSILAGLRLVRASRCVNGVYLFLANGIPLEKLKASRDAKDATDIVILNTESRVKAALKANTNMSGQVISFPPFDRTIEECCDF